MGRRLLVELATWQFLNQMGSERVPAAELAVCISVAFFGLSHQQLLLFFLHQSPPFPRCFHHKKQRDSAAMVGLLSNVVLGEGLKAKNGKFSTGDQGGFLLC